jgi:hypothetical protein
MRKLLSFLIAPKKQNPRQETWQGLQVDGVRPETGLEDAGCRAKDLPQRNVLARRWQACSFGTGALLHRFGQHLAAFLIALAVMVGVSVSAFGGNMSLLGVGRASGGGGGAPTIVPGANVVPKHNNFVPGTIEFTGLNGGVNFPNGAVVYVGFGSDQASTAPASPLVGSTGGVGGQTPTLVTGASESSGHCYVYRVTISGSQPDTFSFTNGAGINDVGVASAYFTNITAAPTGTGNETYPGGPDPQLPSVLSPTATIPATGFGWAFAFAISGSFLSGNVGTWATATPSFITASGGDTSGVLPAHVQIVSAHTTAALAGASSWQAEVSGSPQNFGFIACMGAIAVGP